MTENYNKTIAENCFKDIDSADCPTTARRARLHQGEEEEERGGAGREKRDAGAFLQNLFRSEFFKTNKHVAIKCISTNQCRSVGSGWDRSEMTSRESREMRDSREIRDSRESKPPSRPQRSKPKLKKKAGPAAKPSGYRVRQSSRPLVPLLKQVLECMTDPAASACTAGTSDYR